MKTKYIFAILCLFLFIACHFNFRTARDIRSDFSREYNGIDTLININGYYYGECENRLCGPFILTNENQFIMAFGSFSSHTEIQRHFKTYFTESKKGNFSLSNDTIKAKWVRRYGIGSYDVFNYKLIILNDTTLLRFYSSSKRAKDISINRDEIIYRFYPFDVESLK